MIVGYGPVARRRRAPVVLPAVVSVLRGGAAVVGLVAAAGVAWPSGAAAQELPAGLRALVTDAETGRPIEGATVRVEAEGGKLGRSDADGRVLLGGIAAGSRAVVVRAAGYGTQRLRLELPPGRVLDVAVALGPAGEAEPAGPSGPGRRMRPDSMVSEPIELDPVDVIVERRSERLARTGFYDRAQYGLGTFLPPADLERRLRGSSKLSDALRTVTGVRITAVDFSRYQVQVSRGLASIANDCGGPRIWLDGVRLPADAYQAVNNIVSAHVISAIEIYRGPAEVPAVFGGTGATCGVILIWTGGRSR